MTKPKLVVLTGAGISAESGLRTFRDSDGLWEGYNIEDVATPRAWRKDPKLVLDFYNMRRRDILNAQPNAAHIGLAALENDFDVHIVTQNIDDLHERAGSTNILHLHGEILKMRSEHHPHIERYALPITADIVLGDLNEEGSQLRPHIVWFEEPVPAIEQSIPIMASADVFVLIGTSLAVYPAAGLVDYVEPEVKKYILDKKIPPVKRYKNVINIEMPATEGIYKLKQLLKQAY
ncbi:MAG: Sir2 family NAD-dependent protein deacetylase [Flavipsychrobacter sp.]|nr:Sir2 family NAD-dependent protein deacetylase [Flavipsychrobacter sp.]